MQKIVFLCIFNLWILSSLVQTWDIAIGVNNQIEFYKENGSRVGIASQQFEDVRTITFDPLNHTLYFVDNKHDKVSIFAFHMASKRSIEHIVKKNLDHKVLGIAIDPISEKLFWTVQSSDTIYWIPLSGDNNSSGVGRVFLKLNGESPEHIVVDSCRGNIYWANNGNNGSTIERASIDGSNHKVIIDNNLNLVTGITLHQGMGKLFWTDKKKNFKIESADLNGENRKLIYSGSSHHPYHIAVSKNAIYWTDWTYRKVWTLLKNMSSIKEFRSYGYDLPTGIIINDDLLEQTEYIPECANLREVLIKDLKIYDSEDLDDTIVSNVDSPKYILEYCKDVDDSNGTEKCKNGISRYPFMQCYNFCFNGTCYIDNDNLPKCRCRNGFSGDRCENNMCLDYCLNDGSCIWNASGSVFCLCYGNWTGDRCEFSKEDRSNCGIQIEDDNKNATSINFDVSNSNDSSQNRLFTRHIEITKQLSVKEDRNIDLEQNNIERQNITDENDSLKIRQSGDEKQGQMTDSSGGCVNYQMMSETTCLTIIICLSMFTIGFCMSTIILFFKVLALKKRPRINKRFVVKKNVTPLTAPPQCEVTIENCCNLNICETPCFEPADFIEQVQEAAKKEEKKNLLLNMQHPEDMY